MLIEKLGKGEKKLDEYLFFVILPYIEASVQYLISEQ